MKKPYQTADCVPPQQPPAETHHVLGVDVHVVVEEKKLTSYYVMVIQEPHAGAKKL